MRFIAATPGSPHGANVELKLIDPSANPYLAAAAFLGSALRGIDRGLELPDEVPKDPSRRRDTAAAAPTEQRAVIKAIESSPTAAELLTPAVIEGLVAVRRHEMATFGELPPAETTQALRLAWSCLTTNTPTKETSMSTNSRRQARRTSRSDSAPAACRSGWRWHCRSPWSGRPWRCRETVRA